MIISQIEMSQQGASNSKEQAQPSSLVHGCEFISRQLRYFSLLHGRLYQFERAPPHRPRPLPLLVVLFTCLPPILTLMSDWISYMLMARLDHHSTEYQALEHSVFLQRLARIFGLYQFVASIAFTIIQLATHGSMVSTIASGNQYVSSNEQALFARQTCHFYLFKSITTCLAYLAILANYFNEALAPSIGWTCLALLHGYLILLIGINMNAPLVYTSYLGLSLGKHVENFSSIHVDTMFDQFMKALEKEEDEERRRNGELLGGSGGGMGDNNDIDMNEVVSNMLPEQVRSLSFFDKTTTTTTTTSTTNSQQAVQEENDEYCRIRNAQTEAEEAAKLARANAKKCCCSITCYTYLAIVGRFLLRAIVSVYRFLRYITYRLGARKYPELPEMKMTKLSSTTNIQISETMRAANSHLIRVRLRRTQIMLSELRDLVSDINKTSSPIVLIYLIYETIFIIFVTTASIQGKVYKSIDILILPTIAITLGLVTNVLYMCTCMDQTTKQLKLLINKLFDFIIMNHRVQSTGKRAPKTSAQIHSTDSEVCLISGTEDGAINETWSQFQYTRKLANTIQFTMGGILPVTRRLVLSILGHILSAVFISIEIMSIIDTLNTPEGAPHTSHSNGTSTQYDTRDFQGSHHHHHHHHHQNSHLISQLNN